MGAYVKTTADGRYGLLGPDEHGLFELYRIASPEAAAEFAANVAADPELAELLGTNPDYVVGMVANPENIETAAIGLAPLTEGVMDGPPPAPPAPPTTDELPLPPEDPGSAVFTDPWTIAAMNFITTKVSILADQLDLKVVDGLSVSATFTMRFDHSGIHKGDLISFKIERPAPNPVEQATERAVTRGI